MQFKTLTIIILSLIILCPGLSAEDATWLNRNSAIGATTAYAYYKKNYQQHPTYTSAWQFARAAHFYAYNFLTDYATRLTLYNEGITAAQYAITIAPQSPEAHFWLASCYGSIVEASGLVEGFRYVGVIMQELNTVIQLEPGFADGLAYAIRAKVYFKAPGWPLSIGDINKSGDDFTHAFHYAAGKNRLVYRFYAEYLLQNGERITAQRFIAQRLAIPFDRSNSIE